MPYKSEAQRKYFNWAKSKGKMPGDVVDEFNSASKGMSLPEHVVKKYAYGGDVQAHDIDAIKDTPWFHNSDEESEDDLTDYEPGSHVP